MSLAVTEIDVICRYIDDKIVKIGGAPRQFMRRRVGSPFSALELSGLVTLLFYLLESQKSADSVDTQFELGSKELPHALGYVAIFSSNFTKGRFARMAGGPLSHALFAQQVLTAHVFLPENQSIPVPSSVTLLAQCSNGRLDGLCCRIRVAMDAFLDDGADWFVRAMDDSWFKPHNLEQFLLQLNTLPIRIVTSWSKAI
jgi:hypothetical protein